MQQKDQPEWARSLIQLMARDALHLEGNVADPSLRMPALPTGSELFRRFLPTSGTDRP